MMRHRRLFPRWRIDKMTQNKKSPIPVLLTVLILTFILFLAWAARQASTGGTDITDRDYYSKGLKYNSTLVEKRAAKVIGWSMKARFEPELLVLDLADKQKDPVSGAAGTIVFPEPGSNQSVEYNLQEVTPGRYQLSLPAQMTGERLARIEFELDGARINRQLLLNLPDRDNFRAE